MYQTIAGQRFEKPEPWKSDMFEGEFLAVFVTILTGGVYGKRLLFVLRLAEANMPRHW